MVINTILELINYKEFQWSVGGDLKMVGLLTCLQNGYIKHGCFCVYGTAELETTTTLRKVGL